ncbi:MAG: low specificity L-threonine aldolase [Bacteroidales bacterium]|jgi:threonine aldolase|nr:low specificity L-threonine aldolase [Bacteroidales bacterium]
MKSFASDNNSGVHPEVMNAVLEANSGHAVSYGEDKYTKRADDILKSIFGEDITPYYVFNGTGANIIALQAALQPFHSIITAETGHINVDECGAPVKFTNCMIKEISTKDGKLTPKSILTKLHGFDDQHHSQPKLIYISQSTELGTVYTTNEIRNICELAHEYNMYVHMDGARLANACAFTGKDMKELTRDCGVDILSLGGTKNGMLMGEAVISFKKELSENLKYIRKQSAQLYSKMRFQSAQYSAYFNNNLWLQNATHANKMALLLAEYLKNIPEIKITQKVEANAVFFKMPRKLINNMLKDYFFYIWDEGKNEVRLVCSWDTTEDDIKDFISSLNKNM